MNRITAIRAISRNLGDLKIDSTVASVTGTSVYNDKFIFTHEKQLFGQFLYIDTGAGAGQERVLGSLHPINKFVLVPQAFASIPSTNSTFFITEHFAKTDYDNALDRFIGIAKTRYLEDKVATLQLVASQYEYPVPSGFEFISCLRLVPSGHSDYGGDDEVDKIFEIPPRDFRIEVNPLGTYIIAFDSRKIDLDELDEEWVRVIGQVKPDIGATDNATIPVDLEEYLIASSSMLLASQRITEQREWILKFGMFKDEIKGRGREAGLEDYIFRYGRGRKVKS